MNEWQALMCAVCENPDDDAPRLVFADWLQEHGEEERAEFIRLQIKLARLPDGLRDLTDLVRAGTLGDTRGAEWAAPLKEFSPNSGGNWWYSFRRGFVEALDSTVPVLVGAGERLFRLAPIRALNFQSEPDYAPLARGKWLMHLRALRLTAGAVDEFVPAPLLRSRHLANLTTLEVCGNDSYEPLLGLSEVRALVGSKHLRTLEHLDLSGNCFNESNWTPFECFLARANFPQLRKLNLRCTILNDDGAELLADTPWVTQLRELDLSVNEIRERGLRAILASPYLANIERLDLSDGIERVDYFEPDHPINEAKRQLVERFGNRIEVWIPQ
jgi:uncharacterized protein (TIGR02996 family)